jgi:hypothetical protein
MIPTTINLLTVGLLSMQPFTLLGVALMLTLLVVVTIGKMVDF